MCFADGFDATVLSGLLAKNQPIASEHFIPGVVSAVMKVNETVTAAADPRRAHNNTDTGERVF